jgi:hypothetical protein
MKNQTTPHRFQFTPQEMDALNLELAEDHQGVYRDRENGLWTVMLRIDRIEGLPPAMLQALRQIPRDGLANSAIGNVGYLLYGAFRNGPPPGCHLFVTKRAAEEMWPTH